ncbi:hypothetical protein H6G36_09670 [Anabaena minutissima FACHB-250]|nr:hypothetical protein [Anabaena minutissima FACHB-250]
MSHPITSNEQLLTELTPAAEANIIGGVKIATTNKSKNNSTNITIDNASAKIRVELGKVSPNQSFKNKFGQCSSHFDEFTGQFTFSCMLKNSK